MGATIVAALIGGAATATTVLATHAFWVSVVNIAIGAVVSSIFAPGRPNTERGKSPGQKTRALPNTANRLPILYGVSQTKTAVISAAISSDNKKMGFILALGYGEIEAVDKIFWGRQRLSFEEEENYHSELISPINAREEEDGEDNDFLNSNLKIRVFTAGGRCTEMEDFSTNWSSSCVMTNTPYVYVELEYNIEDRVTGLGDLIFEVRGRKVRTIYKSGSLSTSKRYSTNYAECILDYYTDPISGCGLDDSEINIESLLKLKNFCNEEVEVVNTDGEIIIQKRFQCNGQINTNIANGQNIESLMICCQSTSSFNLGRLGAVVNTKVSEFDVIQPDFSEDIIFGGIEVVWHNSKETINQILMTYTRRSDNFTEDQLILDLPQEALNKDEFLSSRTVDLIFTNNEVEAKILGSVALNQARADITVTFKTNLLGLYVEAGDIFTLTQRDYGFEYKKFRALSINEIEIDGGLGVEITGAEYADEIYDVGELNLYDVTPNTTLLNPNIGGVFSNILVFPKGVYEKSGIFTPNVLVSWDYSLTSYASSYRVFIGENETYSAINSALVRGLQPGTTYTGTIQVRTVFGKTTTSQEFTINTPQIKRPELNSLFISESLYSDNEASGIKVKIDLNYTTEFTRPLRYIIEHKLSSETLWQSQETTKQSATILDITKQDSELPLSLPKSFDFRVKAIDINDISSVYSSETLVILGKLTPPKPPTGLIISVGQTAILSWELSDELDVRQGGSAQIRLNSSSDDWGTAQIVVFSIPGNSTSKSVPLLRGTYLVKFIDSGGRESMTPAVVKSAQGDIATDLVFNRVEHPTFSGSKTLFKVRNESLVSQRPEYYDSENAQRVFANLYSPIYTTSSIDLGAVQNVRVTAFLSSNITEIGENLCSNTNLCNILNLCDSTLSSNINFYIRRTFGDPSKDPYYYPRESLTINNNYTGRAFIISIEAKFPSITRVVIDEFSIGFSIPKITESFNVTTSSTKVTSLSYSPYYAGVSGTQIPNVQATIIDGGAGETVRINATNTGLTIEIVNSLDVRVSKSVDIQVTGIKAVATPATVVTGVTIHTLSSHKGLSTAPESFTIPEDVDLIYISAKAAGDTGATLFGYGISVIPGETYTYGLAETSSVLEITNSIDSTGLNIRLHQGNGTETGIIEGLPQKITNNDFGEVPQFTVPTPTNDSYVIIKYVTIN